jgi:hypothetical protein
MPVNVTVMLKGSQAVLWIRIGFNADPDLDQAFDVNADADSDPGSQINEDPCGSGSWSQKVKFLHEKHT